MTIIFLLCDNEKTFLVDQFSFFTLSIENGAENIGPAKTKP